MPCIPWPEHNRQARQLAEGRKQNYRHGDSLDSVRWRNLGTVDGQSGPELDRHPGHAAYIPSVVFYAVLPLHLELSQLQLNLANFRPAVILKLI